MSDFSYIARNYAEILESIKKTAIKYSVPTPMLLPVTKQASEDELDFLLSLGVSEIAENRVQLFCSRYERLREARPKMHIIGSLQSNKVKYIADKVELIQSLDSISLAKEIERQGEKKGVTVKCLIEINSGREEAKGGLVPEMAAELAYQISELPHIALCGVMTMAPICEKQSDYCKYFSLTRGIFEELSPVFKTEKPILSMGMSESYEAAISEGATLVRIGRSLFKQ